MQPRYSLRQLQVFLAIAQFNSVTKAAEYLAMSQSACSGALKDLENQFNIKLFDRIGKKLQINELGAKLRPRVNQLLEQAENLNQLFLEHNSPGPLSIGATLTVGNYLCVPLIQQYRQLTKGSNVKLNIANTQKIANEILNFEIDIGMIEGDFNHTDIKIIPWQEDELVCFCAPDHPMAGKTLTVDNLAQSNWILRETGSGTRQTFNRAFHTHLHQLNIVLTLEHTEAIRRAVESNLGISCLSRICLERHFEQGTLAPINVEGVNLKRQFYLLLHKHKFMSPGMKKWLEICQTQ